MNVMMQEFNLCETSGHLIQYVSKVFHLLTNFSQQSHCSRWPGQPLNGTKQVLQTFLISLKRIESQKIEMSGSELAGS